MFIAKSGFEPVIFALHGERSMVQIPFNWSYQYLCSFSIAYNFSQFSVLHLGLPVSFHFNETILLWSCPFIFKFSLFLLYLQDFWYSPCCHFRSLVCLGKILAKILCLSIWHFFVFILPVFICVYLYLHISPSDGPTGRWSVLAYWMTRRKDHSVIGNTTGGHHTKRNTLINSST